MVIQDDDREGTFAVKLMPSHHKNPHPRPYSNAAERSVDDNIKLGVVDRVDGISKWCLFLWFYINHCQIGTLCLKLHKCANTLAPFSVYYPSQTACTFSFHHTFQCRGGRLTLKFPIFLHHHVMKSSPRAFETTWCNPKIHWSTWRDVNKQIPTIPNIYIPWRPMTTCGTR